MNALARRLRVAAADMPLLHADTIVRAAAEIDRLESERDLLAAYVAATVKPADGTTGQQFAADVADGKVAPPP